MNMYRLILSDGASLLNISLYNRLHDKTMVNVIKPIIMTSLMESVGPWKVLSKEEKYKNPWMTVTEERVIHPDGKPGLFGIVSKRDGVAVLPIDGDKLYLVNQFRYAWNTNSIEVVCGLTDPGETPEDAARRELQEELGLKAKTLIPLGKIKPLGIMRNTSHLFLAMDLTQTETEREGSEVIEEYVTTLPEAVQKVMNSEIVHWSTVVLIFKAQQYLK